MELLGMIVAREGTPALVYEDWTRVVAEHPDLNRVMPHEGVNPFTRQPMMFHGSPGDARVVIAGETVGTMYWAPDDSARIVVNGDAGRVEPVARDVASQLAALYQPERT
jgi:hypothetical protein